jgi:lipopolysaccharide export system permease protein
VFWSLMFRTILWELVRVFLMSLIGITGMLLMAGIISEATQHGLTPTQLLAAIPLLIPSTLPYTLPATTLFATYVVYGRLAADNEILAIKAAGINIISVVWPAISLGIAMSALTLFLYWNVIPTTHFWMRSLVLQDIEEFLYNVLRKEKCFRNPKCDYAMSVRTVHGRTLIDAVFERMDPKTHKPDLTARAEEAQMWVDLPNKQLKILMERCWVITPGGDEGWYKSREWTVPLDKDLFDSSKKQRTADMTWIELWEARGQLQKQKDDLDAETAVADSLSDPANASHPANVRSVELHFLSKAKQQEVRAVTTEMFMRPALGIGCLCFVVIGCPIGIWFSKSDYLSAFITCFLPIVTLYYPLFLCGSSMAKSGKLPAAPAIGFADMMMMMVAVPLYRKLTKN